jgi:hypothetical protein
VVANRRLGLLPFEEEALSLMMEASCNQEDALITSPRPAVDISVTVTFQQGTLIHQRASGRRAAAIKSSLTDDSRRPTVWSQEETR